MTHRHYNRASNIVDFPRGKTREWFGAQEAAC